MSANVRYLPVRVRFEKWLPGYGYPLVEIVSVGKQSVLRSGDVRAYAYQRLVDRIGTKRAAGFKAVGSLTYRTELVNPQ